MSKLRYLVEAYDEATVALDELTEQHAITRKVDVKTALSFALVQAQQTWRKAYFALYEHIIPDCPAICNGKHYDIVEGVLKVTDLSQIERKFSA